MVRLKAISILLLVLLVSCSKEAELDPYDHLPVGFVTDVEARGAVITTSTLSDMGVSAYYTGTQSWAQAGATATPNRMRNQKVTKSGSVWTTTPVIYWPSSTTEKISFFAYAPYATASNGMTYGANASGAPQITYTAPAAIGNQPDMLIASAIDQTRTATAVPINFTHGLVKVNVSARLAVNLGLLVISSVQFSNIKSTATYNFQTGAWGTASTPTSFGLSNLSITLSLTPVSILGGQFFMFPPQTLSENATLSVTYSLLGITYTKNLKIEGTWGKGKAINYNISL